jgi:CxxC motif-containing protein
MKNDAHGAAEKDIREFLCIKCPNGCAIEAEILDGKLISMEGALCENGKAYVEQELVCPTRTIAASVRIAGGDLPLCSVRLTSPVPKDRIFDVMAEIRKASLAAPVHIGDIVIQDILGLGSDVIVTKNIS